MNKILHYIFDPLCGWCYGASSALAALVDVPGVKLRPLPSGLFAGAGARPMDGEFAAYAWSNDQRIEHLTGQRFTERYRSDVLADRQQRFDSGPATMALTAVALTAPARELDALKAIQQARYIAGQDITQLDRLATVLVDLGLHQAAERLAQPDDELLAADRARVAGAQALLSEFGARGVPTFILEADGHRQLLHSSAAFSNPREFVEQIAAA
ncbi:DsbA family protein [Roseateles chitosanitabidus]|uniref:DsbA family protein n=1 Tax=Roseateles chitosanitabidus TaxID=65048 RepID=UPI00082D9078|nr:DsbA family protein [Roseateles chitosanitabidus]MBO9685110.1 DsbA family protein [Roseateles chitosanitabidus]